jgi:hypothetical protein
VIFYNFRRSTKRESWFETNSGGVEKEKTTANRDPYADVAFNQIAPIISKQAGRMLPSCLFSDSSGDE